MERDHIDENPQNKGLGAFIVAGALYATAVCAPMPWWGGMLVYVVAWFGLIKVAGTQN